MVLGWDGMDTGERCCQQPGTTGSAWWKFRDQLWDSRGILSDMRQFDEKMCWAQNGNAIRLTNNMWSSWAWTENSRMLAEWEQYLYVWFQVGGC
ncbi:uncharacterized protein EAF01_007431 [Botrytis porri]|uniref:uncharacterized protein n=1 Tax=Botrytis porri TaxID=87229 RepID=UPI0019010EE0|nr:uncharacterized protein EAF01_007431 [Botrytis porri]KAF7902133.1 hypothetical protein EAF01_007431 [Botrytis porri]